jgi:chemotaxis protein CheZ
MVQSVIEAAQRHLLQRLNEAVASNDVVAFHGAIDRLLKSRESTLQADVARISATLMESLARFRLDSRIVQLTGREIPDARQRLDHVVNLTEEAAHRTLDLIEKSVPLAEATAKGAAALTAAVDAGKDPQVSAFLAEARANCYEVRRNLTEVMLAQGFQDITGQILRGVRSLIGDVEDVLDHLMSISGVTDAERQKSLAALEDPRRLEGPAVPGVTRNATTDQASIDDLMADLGI